MSELTNDPTTAADAGTGFVMNLGYTVVGNGWDFGASGFDAMKISVPIANNPDGSSITGPSYEYIVFDNATTTQSTLDLSGGDAGQVAGDAHGARAPRRRAGDGARERLGIHRRPPVRRSACCRPERRSSKATIYEFTYTAKDPVVAGDRSGGDARFRFISAARARRLRAIRSPATCSTPTATPSRSRHARLNDFQVLGFNEDEDGRRVLDGILSHTGGGSGDQINYRFAQTGRTERNRQNHLYPEGVFPFAHQVLTDHLSGKTDGRDARCTASNTCPKRFEVNTANEYWVKAGSLLHTDTHGNDLKDPEDVRFYLMSGQSHGVGDVTTRSTCQQFLNPVSPYPAHRALLVALDEWVSNGTEPPKSEVPRHANNTAFAVPQPGSQTGVVPQAALGWPTIPGVTYNGLITTRYFLDFGPDFDDGIVSNYPPSVVGRPAYPIFVSKVDKDGNEIAGVRMPPVEAPIATTTGWALRRAGFSENEGCEANGQHIPFATTKAERLAAGDPRKSLEERYKNHDGYVKAVSEGGREARKTGLPASSRCADLCRGS